MKKIIILILATICLGYGKELSFTQILKEGINGTSINAGLLEYYYGEVNNSYDEIKQPYCFSLITGDSLLNYGFRYLNISLTNYMTEDSSSFATIPNIYFFSGNNLRIKIKDFSIPLYFSLYIKSEKSMLIMSRFEIGYYKNIISKEFKLKNNNLYLNFPSGVSPNIYEIKEGNFGFHFVTIPSLRYYVSNVVFSFITTFDYKYHSNNEDKIFLNSSIQIGYNFNIK